jgi:hypothetical protein
MTPIIFLVQDIPSLMREYLKAFASKNAAKNARELFTCKELQIR